MPVNRPPLGRADLTVALRFRRIYHPVDEPVFLPLLDEAFVARSLCLQQFTSRVPDGATVELHGCLSEVAHDVVQTGIPRNLRLIPSRTLRAFVKTRIVFPAPVGMTGRVQLPLPLLDLHCQRDLAILQAIEGADASPWLRAVGAGHPAFLFSMNPVDLRSADHRAVAELVHTGHRQGLLDTV